MHANRQPQQPPHWPFSKLDPVQARHHLAAQAAVQRLARQAQAERVEAARAWWRAQGAQS